VRKGRQILLETQQFERCIVLLGRWFLNFFIKAVFELKDIPIVIIFKALGITSDQEIVQLIGLEDYIEESLTPCLYEAHSLQVFTQHQAISYIANKIKSTMRKNEYQKKTKFQEAKEFLVKILIAHVTVSEQNMKMKAVYLAVMMRRTVQAKFGKISEDDRDYYGNKRLELAGQLISLLFEDLFKRFNSEVFHVLINYLNALYLISFLDLSCKA